MRRRLAWAAAITLPLLMSGCAIQEVDHWFEQVYLRVVVSRVAGVLLAVTGRVTEILAHTPLQLFQASGFGHVYRQVSTAALIALLPLWAWVGMKVFLGRADREDLYGVIGRTCVCVLAMQAVPLLFITTARITNEFSAAFARDYRALDPASMMDGRSASEVEVALLLFVIILVYYLVRLVLQYAWRVGALTLAHAFAPLFAVMWVLPGAGHTARRVAHGVASLFIIQAAHTLEMWVFTWVTLGVPAEGTGIHMRLLVQLGILQVMVSTPTYVMQHLADWVDRPHEGGREMWRLATAQPLRERYGKALRRRRPQIRALGAAAKVFGSGYTGLLRRLFKR